MAIDLNLSECIPTFTTKKHYEYPNIMQYLNGKLTHPVLGELATVRSLQIQRRIRFKSARDFLEIMDEDSQELHEFSVALFDKYSNVRLWLVDGGSRSGSGCWGTELSIGDMLYIEEVNVKKEFRRCGVGSLLLQKLLTSAHIGYKGHAFCWPTPIGSTTDNKAGWMKEQDAIIAFFHKNGFRRIGLTQFFAYSPDPSHPSHRLAVASDPEAPSREFHSANDHAPDLDPEEIKEQYPLHCQIVTNKVPSVSQVIHAAHQEDAGSLRKRDPNGFTPLHLAAASENVYALRALLELYPSGLAEDLKDTKNKDGMTPLQRLESSMRSTKEFMEMLLGRWDGYSAEGLSCEYLLTKMISPPTEETEEEYIKKRKFGCTCGKCTDGWLSPRMRFRLSAQAALQKDMLSMDFELFKPHQPLSSLELLHSAFDYVPPAIRREIYKTFFVGFYTIFLAIYHILEIPRRGGIPTPQAVLAKVLALDPRAVEFYLNKGGKVEYVLDATVDSAREQSNLGDGTFEETFEHDDSEEEEGMGYAELVKCSNDLEFGIVRRNVGLGARIAWGPYDDTEDEHEGMEVDEDDSDSD